MPNSQEFKDKAVGRMIGRKPMGTGAPARDPRRDGIKNPAGPGEQMTRLEARVKGTQGSRGPRPSGYKQQAGPGMLPNDKRVISSFIMNAINNRFSFS